MDCWAEPIGGCSPNMSREHLISAAVFPGQTVMVHGFPWCRDEPKEIGIAKLVSRILCEAHNNALSPLDTAAGETATTLRTMDHLRETRSKLRQHYWKVKSFEIDGTLMERWFLKTLINVAYDGGYKIGSDAETVGRPSSRLVRIAFGEEKFEGQAGLYFVAKEQMILTMEIRVQCMTLLKNGHIEGGLFNFHGFGFMLVVEPEGPAPNALAGISFGSQDLGDIKPLFRGKSIITRLGKYKSHELKVRW